MPLALNLLSSDTLTVDGRIFDVGVYVAITSISPLRVHVYKDVSCVNQLWFIVVVRESCVRMQVLLRFCPQRHGAVPEQWQPDEFIVKDNYMPVQEVSPLAAVFRATENATEALNVTRTCDGTSCDY